MATQNLPETMKTLLQPSIHSTALKIATTSLPTPMDPDDVLVRVHTCCPCAGELRWAVDYPGVIPADKDPVPCQDLAGTVVSIHANPTAAAAAFMAGDRVFCRLNANRPGAAREYALARASELARIPDALDWVHAAATPLSALTAWQALFVHGTLNARGIQGDVAAREHNSRLRVLVTAAVGGVGSWVVQLAALAGAGSIVAVCSGHKAADARELGATEVVDYTKTSLESWAAVDAAGREVDLAIDCIGGASLAGCWSAVRNGGGLISICALPETLRPEGVKKELAKSLFFIVEPLGSNLAEIAELVQQGKVRPVVDSVWTFQDFEKAFEKLESGHAKGKIVIRVSEEEP